jgi:hypothetical protein
MDSARQPLVSGYAIAGQLAIAAAPLGLFRRGAEQADAMLKVTDGEAVAVG